VRGRIEAILNGAKAEGLRTGENPALWRGHLDQVLVKRKKSDVQHHPALPYVKIPRFMASLAADTSDTAPMLNWIILTACRFNEAYEMDIDAEVKGDTWTIPGFRMKAEGTQSSPHRRGSCAATFPASLGRDAFQLHCSPHQQPGHNARNAIDVSRLGGRLHKLPARDCRNGVGPCGR
jgi:hypothetical protein